MKQFGDRPEYRTRLARYRNNLAILQRALGNLQDSESTLRSTLDLLAPLAEGSQPLPGPRWQVARLANNLGSLLLLRKRTDEAGTPLHQAEGLLRTLTGEFPAVAQYSFELASVEYNLGLAAGTVHPDQAVAAFKESMRLLEVLKERFPEMPAYRMKLAISQVGLGQALAGTTPAEAEGALKKALEEQSALLKANPNVPEYQVAAGRGYYQLGLLLVRSKPAEAILQAEQAGRLLKGVLKIRPGSEPALRYLLENQLLLGNALIIAGRLADAKTVAEEMPALNPVAPRFYVNAVGLLIQCAKAAPDTADGRKQAEECLAGAVDVFRKAIQAKVIGSKATLDFPDFAPLHDRDDFKRLRDSLDAGAHIG